MSLRDSILSAADLKRVPVEVSEWGTKIELREFSGLDRQRFFALVKPEEGQQVDILRYHATAFILGAYEPGGGPVFNLADDAIEGEIREMSGKNVSVFFPLAVRVLDLSGIGKEPEGRAEKNSGSEAPSE